MNRDLDRFRVTIPRRTAVSFDWITAPEGWQGKLCNMGRYLLLLVLALLCAMACSRLPEEEKLRQAVAEMQSAVEAKRPAEVVEWVSEDFVGSHNLDRERLRRLVQVQMFRNASIGVTIGPLDVALQGEHAIVRFIALTTGGSGSLFPDRARGYRVVSEWRIEGGQWRLHRATWADESAPD